MREDLVKEKAIARILFFEFHSVKQICDKTGVGLSTVNTWAQKWREDREIQTIAIVQAVREKNSVEIAELFSVGIPMIRDSLVAIAKTGKQLTLREAKYLTDILCAFDKIQRLDIGKPTEITEERVMPVTIEELRNAVIKDQFIDITPEGK